MPQPLAKSSQMPELRIISLIASATEIIHALGLGDKQVGRSHECDFPMAVRDLPQCTAPKFDVDASSIEIDLRIKYILENSLSVYKVDAEIIDELAPTHIITQAQCEVCAVSLKDVEEAACNLIHSNPKIISLSPDCLEDFYDDLLLLGKALGVDEKAQALMAEMQDYASDIKMRAAQGQNPGAQPPRVAVIEWIQPLMAAGNWVPQFVQIAGGINLFGVAGRHSPWMQIEDLIASNPDVIVVTPCGFDNERTAQEIPLLLEAKGFTDLNAVREHRLYLADGNQYFNRQGPRLKESLRIMAEMIHPDIFERSFDHSVWRAW